MNEKMKKCKFRLPVVRKINGELTPLYVCKKKKCAVITEEDCISCKLYKNRFIEFPVSINGIQNEEFKTRCEMAGKIVKVKPKGDEYGDKIYIGLLVGDIPAYNHISLLENTNILKVAPITNSAIFIFELNKLVLGIECWWDEVKTLKELFELETDEKKWYMVFAKERVEDMKNQEDNVFDGFADAYIITKADDNCMFLKFEDGNFVWKSKEKLSFNEYNDEHPSFFENINDAYGYAYNVANLESSEFVVQKIMVRNN